jgi:hypothetical protein
MKAAANHTAFKVQIGSARPAARPANRSASCCNCGWIWTWTARPPTASSNWPTAPARPGDAVEVKLDAGDGLQAVFTGIVACVEAGATGQTVSPTAPSPCWGRAKWKAPTKACRPTSSSRT